MQNIYPNSWSSGGFFCISARGQLITNSTYIMYVQEEPSWRDQCNKDLFSVDGGASVLVLNESLLIGIYYIMYLPLVVHKVRSLYSL